MVCVVSARWTLNFQKDFFFFLVIFLVSLKKKIKENMTYCMLGAHKARSCTLQIPPQKTENDVRSDFDKI